MELTSEVKRGVDKRSEERGVILRGNIVMNIVGGY